MHYLRIRALVYICFEVFDRLPNGKIHYDSVIIIRTNPSRVTLFSLKPPNKSRASIRKGVDLTKRRHELGHQGIIKRREHSRNIYLSDVIFRSCHLISSLRLRPLTMFVVLPPDTNTTSTSPPPIKSRRILMLG